MSTETITIPRPHVPYGPAGVDEWLADADYLRSAARGIEYHGLFGSNLNRTVAKLLRDAADAVAGQEPATPDALATNPSMGVAMTPERLAALVEAEPCPGCSGPVRRTVGMVCQTCGKDYAPREAVLPERIVDLIRDLTDPDDCWFDHHGGCQAHGYLSLEPGEKCPHAEAKEVLRDATTTTDPKDNR